KYRFFYSIIVTIIMVWLFSCQTNGQMRETIMPEPSRQHEGTWVGKDCDGRRIKLVIHTDGTANMVIDKNNLKNTLKAATCLYIINYKDEPATLSLDFMTQYFDVTEIKMKVDFLGSKMMRVWTNFNETEPTDQDRMFILKRK
ncbi:MAG: hypothetical protein J6W76_05930, partial [Spirochaetales bacterium]|nr:hypothetical protein [Spirochaetales bacterium]